MSSRLFHDARGVHADLPGRQPHGIAVLVLAVCSGVLSLTAGAVGVSAEERRTPNIVFILADDLGWRDVGCYGSSFHATPHIDSLARRGMRFTQAYAASPFCSPTRASILTGQYPARIGITIPVCHVPQVVLEKGLQQKAGPQVKVLGAESVTRLKTDYYTLAEALKDAGYATGHFGKWHLGAEPYSPLEQGFGVDVPHTSAPGPGGGYLAPWKFLAKQGFTGQPGESIEDRMAAEAERFIRTNRNRPFYLNYWAFSVHSPWQGKPGYVEDAARRVKPGAAQCNPVYAAMVRSLDDSVGHLLAVLDELKIAEQTIIVFFSDNGGYVNAPKREGVDPRFADVPVTSNAPLRSGKGSIYEGGTREPCIVVWPGKVQPGSVSNAFVQSIDFYPTLLAMCGLTPKPGVRLDGMSQVPALLDRAAPRDTVFCHFPHGGPAQAALIPGMYPSTSVRRGDWKLIRFYAGNADQTDRVELYNLREDIGEARNLAAQMREKVGELAVLLDRFLADTQAVIPKANPDYVPPDRWSAGKDAKLELRGGKAVVHSASNRPTLQLLETPQASGTLIVKFRARVSQGRGGLVLWGTDKEPGFASVRRAAFAPQFDGEWHDYEVRFATSDTLKQLRIDASLAPTSVEFEWIRLCGNDGKVIKQWRF
jgi:arylsulfatase A-like enzyme